MRERDIAPAVLSDTESRAVLEGVILPTWTRGAVRQGRPVVVFVAGPPGAGKTEVADLIQAALTPRGGAVRIASDLYKSAHRHYARLLAQDVRSAGAAVRADVRRWQAGVEAYVREHGFDAVVESALSDPQEFRASAQAYRASGHRIEVVAVATALAWSQLGTLDRFIEQVLVDDGGRYVSWENLDNCAAGLVESLTAIEAERLAERVALVGRGIEPLYSNELAGGAWVCPPAAAARLRRQWALPWTAAQTQVFRRESSRAEVRLHSEAVPPERRLAVRADAERAFALSEPVRRIAQAISAPPGVDYHRLSAEEHDWIFEELVVPGYLSGLQEREKPVAVFVMGQPGTYKTWVANLVQRALRPGAARIAGDVFKAHHPDYHQLLQEDPRRAGAAIRADYQAWQARAEQYVQRHHADAVIEIAPGSPARLLEGAQAWRRAGHRVELVAIAARAADSRQATARRYASQQREGLPSRFTTAAGHDHCYTALPEGLWAAEQVGAADLVTVVRRDATVLYQSRPGHSPAAALALELERRRPYTDQEARQFLTWQRELHATLPQHRAELAQITALARPLMPAALARHLTQPAPPAALPACRLAA